MFYPPLHLYSRHLLVIQSIGFSLSKWVGNLLRLGVLRTTTSVTLNVGLADVLGDLVPEGVRSDTLLRVGRLALVLVLHGYSDAEARPDAALLGSIVDVLRRSIAFSERTFDHLSFRLGSV